MSDDPIEQSERANGVAPPASFGSRMPGAAGAPGLDRLPPPAFPPGSRRRTARTRGQDGTEALVPGAEVSGEAPEGEDIPTDASISADEPSVGAGSRIEDDAFISPDDPLPPRRPEQVDPDEVVVTGMGDNPHLEDGVAGPDGAFDEPYVAELVERVGRLADALRDRGEAGLKTTPDMSRFEATLRAYCTGWLASRREAYDDG